MNPDPMLWTGLGCILIAGVILWRRAARKAPLKLQLNLGPVMWRCTNGAPNYRTTWWVRTWTYTAPPYCAIAVTPFLTFTPWHRGVLSSIEDLGQSGSSLILGIEWIRWSVGIHIGVTRNTMTQAQIDARMSARDLR